MPPLTIAERLHQMPFGGQVRVAVKCGVSKQYVSKVMNDEIHPKTEQGFATLDRVQSALAAELGRSVKDVFPETKQEAARRRALAS